MTKDSQQQKKAPSPSHTHIIMCGGTTVEGGLSFFCFKQLLLKLVVKLMWPYLFGANRLKVS